jgi:hypothetical protein
MNGRDDHNRSERPPRPILQLRRKRGKTVQEAGNATGQRELMNKAIFNLR